MDASFTWKELVILRCWMCEWLKEDHNKLFYYYYLCFVTEKCDKVTDFKWFS